MNTFQAVLITNGTASYAVFTYPCGSINWSTPSTVIGYNAAGLAFSNHPMSGRDAKNLGCENSPASNLSNVFYDLIKTAETITEPDPYEPRESNRKEQGCVYGCVWCNALYSLQLNRPTLLHSTSWMRTGPSPWNHATTVRLHQFPCSRKFPLAITITIKSMCVSFCTSMKQQVHTIDLNVASILYSAIPLTGGSRGVSGFWKLVRL